MVHLGVKKEEALNLARRMFQHVGVPEDFSAVSLPVLILFGSVLAWIRSSTDSVLPGVALHGTFNLIALVAAVVH